MLEVFGISFSIMGLLPSIASTLAFSIPAGPVGMVWGWFLASGCIFVVGVAMADLGSAMPTSGGLYWWYVEDSFYLVRGGEGDIDRLKGEDREWMGEGTGDGKEGKKMKC